MQESTLHSQLKTFYSQDGGSIEVWVDGYLIDVVKGDQLIEIQTGNFSALKAKITALVENHPILVVYPIAREKRIITKNQEITYKQVWVGTPMQFGDEVKQNMANVFVQAPNGTLYTIAVDNSGNLSAKAFTQ